jgi:hypothetical protein
MCDKLNVRYATITWNRTSSFYEQWRNSTHGDIFGSNPALQRAFEDVDEAEKCYGKLARLGNLRLLIPTASCSKPCYMH